MTNLKFLLLLVSAIFYSVPVLAIYNGIKTNPGEFNQVVGYSSSLGDCSGIFLTEKIMLTAAHCLTITDEVVHERYISLSIDNKYKAKLKRVSKIIKHEKFQMKKDVTFSLDMTAVDVALIYFQNDVASEVGASVTSTDDLINLDDVVNGSDLTIVGFGLDEKDELKYKKKTVLNYLGPTTFGSIKIGNTDRESSLCKGDSGGAVYLFANQTYHLIGLLSGITKECGSHNQEANSVPILKNLDWIKENI